MRLKLSLTTNDRLFPLNYNYYLSSAIYKLLHFGSPKFTTFLHDKGFQLNGKPYKLFSFALRFDHFLIGKNNLRLLSPQTYLFISSPLIEDFIQNFIIGTFEKQFIEINDRNYKCILAVSQIESLPEPKLKEINYFKMLSPMVLSTVEEKENVKSQHFFRYNEDISEINRVFNQNLKNKYKLIYNTEYEGDDLIFIWDEDYINQKLKEGKRLTKKISVQKNGERPIEIIANEIPFTVTGNKKLIMVGYDCGFGEKNSMGFGMAEVIN
jgi:CRISPR-associated endoribonuclease Cas6